MAADFWIVMTPVAALIGAGVGAVVASARARRSSPTAAPAATPDAGAAARMQEQLAAAQQRAQAELGVARAEWQKRLDEALALQRAENDKLKLHLTEAFDEIERLRHQVGSGAGAKGPNTTSQGFAATMPMQDL